MSSAGKPDDAELPKTYGAALGRWSGYMRELFVTRQPPPLGSVIPDKIEAAAREKLKDSPGMYRRTVRIISDNPLILTHLRPCLRHSILLPRSLTSGPQCCLSRIFQLHIWERRIRRDVPCEPPCILAMADRPAYAPRRDLSQHRGELNPFIKAPRNAHIGTDYPVRRQVPVSTHHFSSRCSRSISRGWRAGNCTRCGETWYPYGTQRCFLPFHRSCRQGERCGTQMVPALLVRANRL